MNAAVSYVRVLFWKLLKSLLGVMVFFPTWRMTFSVTISFHHRQGWKIAEMLFFDGWLVDLIHCLQSKCFDRFLTAILTKVVYFFLNFLGLIIWLLHLKMYASYFWNLGCSLPSSFFQSWKIDKILWEWNQEPNSLLSFNEKICFTLTETEFHNQFSSPKLRCIAWTQVAENKYHQKCLQSLSNYPETLFCPRFVSFVIILKYNNKIIPWINFFFVRIGLNSPTEQLEPKVRKPQQITSSS